MSDHWTEQRELGGGTWQFRILLRLFRAIGPWLVGLLTRPIVLFTYLGAGKRRGYSRDFLRRVHRVKDGSIRGRYSVIRHFQSFASNLVDKMSAWAGVLLLEDVVIDSDGDFDTIIEMLKGGKGIFALCSHLGNIEVLRALGKRIGEEAYAIPHLRILAIVDFEGTKKFNNMLKSINSDSMEGVIPVTEIGPDTIIQLKDFLGEGGMVVIAGDRTTPGSESRRLSLDFLGKPADFPYGSYFLADLLEAPVFTVFAIREGDVSITPSYRYYFHAAPVRMGGDRKGRNDRIIRLARFFRDKLEELAMAHPYQWFNFYPFWNNKEVQ